MGAKLRGRHKLIWQAILVMALTEVAWGIFVPVHHNEIKTVLLSVWQNNVFS